MLRRGDGKRMPGADRDRQTPGASLRVMARLLSLMGPWRVDLAGVLAVSLLSIGCDLSVPLAIERCINAIGGMDGFHPEWDAVRSGLTLFAALCVLSAGADYLQGLLSARLSTNVEKDLRTALFARTVRMPVERLERMRQGDLMSRIFHDARLASTAFSDAVVSLLCSVLVIVGCLCIMFWKCAELAAVTVAASFLSLLVTFLVSGLLLPRFKAQQDALGTMNAHISESLATFRSGLEGVRLERDRRRMAETNRAYYAARMRVCWLEGLVEPLVLLLGNLTFLLIVAWGVYLAIQNRIGLGTVQAFILYFRQFMEPVNGLGECWVGVQGALSGAGRVFDILDREDEADTLPSGDAEIRGGEGFLRFEEVRFGYRRNLPVLKGLDLCVEKGQQIAIVGRTGVGKTTVFNLLERFYQQYTGRITLEGREIRQIPLEELRRRVTVIPQEPQLLGGTVSRSITCGAQDIPAERVRVAAEKVGIAGFIQSLPDGYDTVLDSAGGFFSQGQLQLLCLARAFLRGGDILLLDEATSSLDTATEAGLQDALSALARDRTCITIAHRLSTVVNADLIVVLEDGAVCETGTHRQLMRRRGAYYELFMNQYWGKEI